MSPLGNMLKRAAVVLTGNALAMGLAYLLTGRTHPSLACIFALLLLAGAEKLGVVETSAEVTRITRLFH